MAKASAERILIANPKAPFFDPMRGVMRFHHYAIRAEQLGQAGIWCASR